jgi:hypothetical protein
LQHVVVQDCGLVKHLHGDEGARVGVDRELHLANVPCTMVRPTSSLPTSFFLVDDEAA